MFPFCQPTHHNLVLPFTPSEPHTHANPCVSLGVICGGPHGLQGMSVRWGEGHPWTIRWISALFPCTPSHPCPPPFHPHLEPRTPADPGFFPGVTCGEPCVIRRMLVRCGQGHLDTWRYNLFSFYHQHSHNLVFPFTPFEPHTPANPCVSHGVICGEPHGMQGISVRWREGHPWTTRCIFALFPSHSAIPPLPPFTPTSNLEHPPTRAFFPGSHAGNRV